MSARAWKQRRVKRDANERKRLARRARLRVLRGMAKLWRRGPGAVYGWHGTLISHAPGWNFKVELSP